MANISISDQAGLTADLRIRDDSPLAKAGLTQIVSTVTRLAGNFSAPVGSVDIRTLVFGGTFQSPSALIADAATLAVKGTASGALSIFKPSDLTLFGDDPFAPPIAIAGGECWLGCEIDATFAGKLGATVDGFGVAVGAAATLSLATYSKVPATAVLRDALELALGQYTVASSARAIRSQPPDTVAVIGTGGTISLRGSYSLPLSVDALASVNLPFNYSISVVPAATAEVAGRIDLTGDFCVRCYKVSNTEVRLGVYKKQGSALTASLTASAGIDADLGKTDLLGAIMGAVLPAVDVTKAGITGDTAAALNQALKDGIDRSLSIAVNIECRASNSDEAAVVYSIDLASGDEAATDQAFAAALAGDWTLLDALPNARPLRNIVRNTREYRQKLSVSLLGIYSAASVDDFTRSSTILHDQNGRIVITDQATATRLAAAATPLAADPDKLDSALAEAFLATVTYTAAAAGAPLSVDLSVSQTWFRYRKRMSRQEMLDAVLLARALGYVAAPEPGTAFPHARVFACVRYDRASAMRLFFADPATRTPHTRAELERIGREAMLALIDPGDDAADIRRRVLADDNTWSAMDQTGNVAQFRFIPSLGSQWSAVAADWIAVAWWADAMEKVAPQLADVLAAPNDAAFAARRGKLAAALAAVTRNTHAAFVGGWGLAVMYALCGRTATAQVEIALGQSPALPMRAARIIK
jgi:hypothetical protein